MAPRPALPDHFRRHHIGRRGLLRQLRVDLGYRRINLTRTALLAGGLWYSVPALLILGCHEMGHYFACRYYNISATLPYFIPAPIVSLFGTLGAVIRIREPLRTKRILFDVGVAGPLAGFAVLLPALIFGSSGRK